MTALLLATCADWPEGEPFGEDLVPECRRRGLDARWAIWDDPAVDWSTAEVVAVRSVWDYVDRREEFLTWARAVGPRLLHGADALRWNTDKRYLLDLAEAGVPVVPTVAVADRSALPAALAPWPDTVVKPCVGASGVGLVVVHGARPDDVDGSGPWVAQPLVASVREEGEQSVYVFSGEPASQVRKVAVGEEVRVHEEYGGSTVQVGLDPDLAALARRTVAAAEGLLGVRLVYARVDVLRLDDGRWAVGELEATEPGLYLDVVPENAAAYAEALAAHAARG